MSKSRNVKWYDIEDISYDYPKRKDKSKLAQRRKQKKVKQSIRDESIGDERIYGDTD